MRVFYDHNVREMEIVTELTTNIKDSGQRSEFDTGARRDSPEGRGRFDLLQPHGILEVAKLLEAGANKYGERNWEKGIPVKRFIESALRHLNAALMQDQSEPHLVQAAWNCLCAIDTVKRIARGKFDPTLADELLGEWTLDTLQNLSTVKFDVK